MIKKSPIEVKNLVHDSEYSAVIKKIKYLILRTHINNEIEY